MNEILHAQEFQKIESAWRGLHYLVFNSETDSMLKIRVMNVSQERALPEPAALSRRALGPEPAVQEGLRARIRPARRRAVRLPDRRLPLQPPADRRAAAARPAARSPARAHAPFFAGADPTLLGMDSWTELSNPRDIGKIFDTPDYAAWKSLRDSADSRYLGPVPAARAGAPALRREVRAGRGVRLRGGDRRPQGREIRLDERRLRDGGEHQPRLQGIRLVAPASAACSRAAR